MTHTSAVLLENEMNKNSNDNKNQEVNQLGYKKEMIEEYKLLHSFLKALNAFQGTQSALL